MPNKAFLVLEDGSWYQGESFGSNANVAGEVVFNTSMTGYQEMLTDPSYSGQIVVPTYPIIGNYGINPYDAESNKIQVAGFVVRDYCLHPSHNYSNMSLNDYLESENISGISGIDTRSLTRRIRQYGVMMGRIINDIEIPKTEDIIAEFQKTTRYEEINFISKVSTGDSYSWGEPDDTKNKPLILVNDYGLKYNILRILRGRGCRVMALPVDTSAADIMALHPDGIILSPGPGDPALLDNVVENTKELIGKVPIMGICLGHQILARAFGANTFKLKFGHRGANHPVFDMQTNQVHITAQNHGYAVDKENFPHDLEISHISLHDGTVEGMKHKELPILGIQYHSEASPGPLDSLHIFDRFLDLISHSG